MDDERPPSERSGAIEGADDAALGRTPPPEPPSPAAQVDDDQQLVPGADFGDRVADESKPWSTTLAYESGQAGVANDHPAEQDRQFPQGDDEAVEDDRAR
jgi:hypothetical protein